MYICLYMYLYVYTCTYMFIHVPICLYMYLYVYTCTYTCTYMFIYMYVPICELRLLKANKATNLRALFSIFIEKRPLRWDSNPRPPAFKTVALPTEPPRQPSWLGSNHTSYARQSVYVYIRNGIYTCICTHTGFPRIEAWAFIWDRPQFMHVDLAAASFEFFSVMLTFQSLKATS